MGSTSFFTLRSRAKGRFYCLLLILVIVLVFNVAGCDRILNRPARWG